MARTIVSTSQLCLSRQQQEFLAKYRTASAMQAYLDSYGEGENNFLDSTSSGGSSKPVTPDAPLPYDFEVQYLEVNANSGLAYIDTDFLPNENDYVLDASFRLLDFSSDGYCCLYGYLSYNGSLRVASVRYPISSNNFSFILCNTSIANVPVSFGVDYNLHMNSLDKLYLNEESYDLRQNEHPEAQAGLYLFSSVANYICYMRYYSFAISRGSEKLIDMIPVSVDGVGYMYDKVRKELFGAKGGGSFVVGPRKV